MEPALILSFITITVNVIGFLITTDRTKEIAYIIINVWIAVTVWGLAILSVLGA